MGMILVSGNPYCLLIAFFSFKGAAAYEESLPNELRY